MVPTDRPPLAQTLALEVDSSREGGDLMVTHYFLQPVAVVYRTAVGRRRVLALGVRRDDDTYAVLITCPLRDTRTTWWVPRSQVCSEDPDALSFSSS